MPKNCPICRKPAQPAFAPFCGKRCADIDLGKWFKGDYAVPAVERDDIDEESLDSHGENPQ